MFEVKAASHKNIIFLAFHCINLLSMLSVHLTLLMHYNFLFPYLVIYFYIYIYFSSEEIK